VGLPGHRILVKERLPRAAQEVLERGTLLHLAVRTPRGPHLTPLVYVLDRGRLWFTTSRTSVKARALRGEPSIAGMIWAGEKVVTFRGNARTYDALDPLSWPSAAVASPRLVRAATRFSLKNARFFAGYAVDARKVPLAWTPPGRVFVGMEVSSGSVLDLQAAAVTRSWGGFGAKTGSVQYRRSLRPLRPRRALDLGVPRSVRSVIGNRGVGTLALAPAGGDFTVIPVRWRRVPSQGIYEVTVARAFLELAETFGPERGPGVIRAALAMDHLSSWRASEMVGMLVQGEADALVRAPDPNDKAAIVRLRPRRVVWWRGWSSGMVTGT
jgi:Pyridoxamine 5'-phosphate oxidase